MGAGGCSRGWVRDRLTDRSRRMLRAPMLALTIAALSLAAALPATAAAKVRTGPAGSAFYHPPKQLPARHGTLIWTRDAAGMVPLAKAASTKLVLYTSIAPHDKRTAVSGSVSVPR